MDHEYHERTRTHLLDGLCALGVDTVLDPTMEPAETIYTIAGAIAAVIAADLTTSASAGLNRSEAIAAFASGWSGVSSSADMDKHEQSGCLAVLFDCLARVAFGMSAPGTNSYAPTAAIAARFTGELAALAAIGPGSEFADQQHRIAVQTFASLQRAWRHTRKAEA